MSPRFRRQNRWQARLRLTLCESRIAPANFTVTTLTDFGAGSGLTGDLRYCLNQANNEALYPGADTISFDAALFATAKVIVLTSGELPITSPVTIQGTNQANVSINGNATGRIFNLSGPGRFAVAISKLTLTNGRTTGISAYDGGGAITLVDQDLTLTDCLLTLNKSEAEGGAISVRDAAGSILATDCVFSKNSSTGTGFAHVGSGGAIAISAPGTLSLQRCTITGNSAAANGGGIDAYFGATCTILNSTIDSNTATGSGGGIYFFGSTGSLTLTNSTVSSNRASDSGGGIELNSFNVPVTIRNSTFTGNSASAYGGGLDRNGGTGSVSITSTIIAGNNANTDADVSLFPSSSISGNNNLFGIIDPSIVTLAGSGNQSGTKIAPLDAKLGTLANNGGSTQTHLLLAGSPAIDQGENSLGFTADQRGCARLSGAKADVGAVEIPSAVPSAAASAPDVTSAGASPLAITVIYADNLAIETASLGTGDLVVTGPNGYFAMPTFLSVNPTGPGSPRVATYELAPPGGAWDQAGLGLYSILMNTNQVLDTNANAVEAGIIGSFRAVFPGTFVVDSFADEIDGITTAGQMSLREAIALANANSAAADTITFSPGIFNVPRTIALSKGVLSISDGITITGPGSQLLTIDGGLQSRIFDINVPVLTANIALQGMTLTHGKESLGLGGAIRSDDERLVLSGIVVGDSTAPMGGGIAIGDFGSLTLENTTVSGNSASTGGGVYFRLSGALSVTDSTVSGNTAIGGQGGGGIYFFGQATSPIAFINSTISGNFTNADGGGIALHSFSGGLLVRNSTLTLNSSGQGGGICLFTGAAAVTLSSSIVAGNTGGTTPDMSFASATNISGNNNVVGDAGSGNFSLAGVGNQAGTFAVPLSAKLGALHDNGGPTPTHAPLPGSPVLGNGNNTAGLAFDQRGVGHLRVIGGKADVGAYQMSPPTIVGLKVADGSVQRSMVQSLTVTFSENVALPPLVSSAFQLERIGPGGPTGQVTLSGVQAGAQVTLTFTDPVFAPSISPGNTKSLIDGRYKLTVLANAVTGLGGSLDGNGDGTAGDDYSITGDPITNGLYRLFGDQNGDGSVLQSDYNAFRIDYLLPSTVFDADGSGVVDQADYQRFRNNFNSSI